jgi:nitrogen fixation protein FixH
MGVSVEAKAVSRWRYFPYAMIGAIGLMVLVDGGLAWTALHSFPGRAESDVFEHSNRYDVVLKNAATEAAYGWTMTGEVEAGRPVVSLFDREGHPLAGVSLTGVADRPLGASRPTELVFDETQPGRYVARAELALPGQWDLRLAAVSSSGSLHATRRVAFR